MECQIRGHRRATIDCQGVSTFSQNTPVLFSRSSNSGTLRRLPLNVRNAREKLSSSAATLFQRFGYARVNIRDIPSSVDIPKGAFYNYFKSKEALASAVLSQHFDALLDTLSDGESAGARFRRHLTLAASPAE